MALPRFIFRKPGNIAVLNDKFVKYLSVYF